jgi:Putative zinc-finger
MSDVSCREIRHALGVYVLGAIDPGDRAQVDEHLATCADCREELASLAGLPALLRRVPTAEAQRLAVADPAEPATDETVSDHMLPALLARTAHRRRVHRWRELAAAAAVVVLALGAGAAGASLLGSSQPAPRSPVAVQIPPAQAWHTVTGTDQLTGTTMTVKYVPMSWGTAMVVRVVGIPSGTVCNFQITDSEGHRWVVGGWRVNYRSSSPTWYPASTSLADAMLHSFQVTVGGKVMATVDAA